jgi:hypothetical protein
MYEMKIHTFEQSAQQILAKISMTALHTMQTFYQMPENRGACL